MTKDRLSGRLVVILHADVADSTMLVQQNRELAHERIRDSFQRFGATIATFHGRVLEIRGDALLAHQSASRCGKATFAYVRRQHLLPVEDTVPRKLAP